MKYYSDALEKFFETEQDCLEAESKKMNEDAKEQSLVDESQTRIKELEKQLDVLCDEAEKALEEADEKVAKIYEDLYLEYQPKITALKDRLRETEDDINDYTTKKREFKFKTPDGGTVEGSYAIRSNKEFVETLADLFNRLLEE